MVMAGMGVCFMPEYSVVVPGLQTRRVIEPDVVREVSVVTVAGHRFSPAVAAFVRGIKAYPWPTFGANPELLTDAPRCAC